MTTLSQSAISIPKLRAELAGDVIGPEDAQYKHARRVFLPLVDRRPAVIVRPPDADGVARVVSLARESGVELAVRSGGHSSAGHGVCEDGIVLDLSRMNALEIDPGRQIARAETGLTAGEVTNALAAHGLAVGLGDTGSAFVRSRRLSRTT